jgi:hypothetical protein
MNREWWSRAGSRLAEGGKILKRAAYASAGVFVAYQYFHIHQTQKKILSIPDDSVLLWKFDKVCPEPFLIQNSLTLPNPN